jgi:hypothetical protein
MYMYILYVYICINEKSKGNATPVANASKLKTYATRMLAYANATQQK